jgi:hypothetical protein
VNVSASSVKRGEAATKARHDQKAADYFHPSLTLVEPLEPADLDAQYAPANTWHRIEYPNHTTPDSFQVGDPTVVAKELKLTEAALVSLHEPACSADLPSPLEVLLARG